MSKLPTLRRFHERDAAHKVAQVLADVFANNREAFRSCLSCRHFVEAGAYCTIWNGNPPPRIIVYSCDKYEDKDDVPF